MQTLMIVIAAAVVFVAIGATAVLMIADLLPRPDPEDAYWKR